MYAKAIRTKGEDLATCCAGGCLGHTAHDADFGGELLHERG